MSVGTVYEIVFTVGNSKVRIVKIKASSPMIAFKKFKELMPDIVFKGLLIDEIIECKEKNVYYENTMNFCEHSVFEFIKNKPLLETIK